MMIYFLVTIFSTSIGPAQEPEAQSPRDCRSTSSEAMEPPLIEDLSPDNIHILRGKKFTLKAQFVGEPVPNVRWYRQKEELKSGQLGVIYIEGS